MKQTLLFKGGGTMLVPNQLVEVTVSSHTFKHYQELGYDVRKGDSILVPPSDLTNGSHVRVEIECDICGEKYKTSYQKYNNAINDINRCRKCASKKGRQTCLEKYGNENISAIPSIREKIKQTCLERYGVCHPLQNEQVKNKLKQTNIELYGVEYVTKSDVVREKIKSTWMNKYGVDNPFSSNEIQNKVKQTSLLKYGEVTPAKNPIVQAKIRQSLTENGTGKASSQQIQLHQIVQRKYPTAELNYPFSTCSLDIFICVDNVNIDIEYDCWYWHQDQQRDIKRDKFLQSQEFKILRIRSGHLLPNEQDLFDAIDYLVNTEHHFKEIILEDWKS